MMIEGGELVIAPANCKAVVAGSGIASGYTEWDGKIVIEQKISLLQIPNAVVSLKSMDGNVGFKTYTDMRGGVSDEFGRYTLNNKVTLLGLVSNVEMIEEEE